MLALSSLANLCTTWQPLDLADDSITAVLLHDAIEGGDGLSHLVAECHQ